MLETIVPEIDKGNIQNDQFGVISLPSGLSLSNVKTKAGGVTSLRKGKPGKSNWNEGADDKSKTRLIVFVVGGLSYAEIRALKDLEARKEIESLLILGSTSIIKPSDYINGIGKMISLSEYEEKGGVT